MKSKTLIDYSKPATPDNTAIDDKEDGSIVTRWGAVLVRKLERVDDSYPEATNVSCGRGALLITFHVPKDSAYLKKHFKTETVMPYFNSDGNKLCVKQHDRKGQLKQVSTYHLDKQTYPEPTEYETLAAIPGVDAEKVRAFVVTVSWNRVTHSTGWSRNEMNKYLKPMEIPNGKAI